MLVAGIVGFSVGYVVVMVCVERDVSKLLAG